MLELTSSARTGLAGTIAFMSYTVGEVFVTLFAYVTRHWEKLKWANLAFIGLSLPYLYFMPESPLYLYARGQYTALEKMLRRIATHNGRKETEWYSYYQDLIHQQPVKMTHTHEVILLKNTHRALFHRSTVLTLLITCLISLTTIMIYFQISYGLSVMNTSPYLAILVAAVVEAISYLTSSLLITTKLGRKGSFIILMSLTILFVLLIPIMTKYSSTAAICTAQLAKYSISAANAITWIFVPELFPTSFRSTANGYFIAFGRIGAILAPVISTSISNEYSSYAFYASSLLALLVLLSSLYLPETKDKPMDYTPDYADNRSEI
jgi:Na+/melibiose symporter-like transporter